MVQAKRAAAHQVKSNYREMSRIKLPIPGIGFDYLIA
jgi:hypothetical protein